MDQSDEVGIVNPCRKFQSSSVRESVAQFLEFAIIVEKCAKMAFHTRVFERDKRRSKEASVKVSAFELHFILVPIIT